MSKISQVRLFFLNGALIIFGIIIGLVLSETILTISAKILLNWQTFQYRAISKKGLSSKKDKEVFKILCIGDSSTCGVEVPYSYPCQLSVLLNRQPMPFEVAVISTNGVNSSQLANRYEEFLKTDNYDLVIFQGGNNDVHNLRECNLQLYTINYPLKWLTASRLFYLFSIFIGNKKILPAEIWGKDQEYGIGTYLFLDETSLKKLLRCNLSKVVALSKKYNVRLWVQDYHTIGWMNPDAVLNEVYEELELKVIHQRDIFDYAYGIRIRDKDGWHPNCYGYSIIARLIYNNMVDYGIAQGAKYDLRSEIDTIRNYTRDKKEGYQCLIDDGSTFNENNFINVLKNVGITFNTSDISHGMFRINGIFDFDKN